MTSNCIAYSFSEYYRNQPNHNTVFFGLFHTLDYLFGIPSLFLPVKIEPFFYFIVS